ncbi:uncharacterized protein SOCE26_004780 [Sorangium cellulosum]|uniref:Secreted protein n=2 Tax=Sorangium cellulosum TaxID=56 RepID=A0A2L0EIH8_SORCE|nr:uncharacterized protein SOCE26_004780 [Sorangium cellulosum]
MKIHLSALKSSFPVTTARGPQRSKLAVLAALAASALLGATGCVAEVRTRTVATAPPPVVTYREVTVYEEPVVHIAAAPVQIETYPRVYYRGTYVYYVDGRWYYPSRHGWVYYREEPRALVRYRVDFERHRPHKHYRAYPATTRGPMRSPHVEHHRPHVHVEHRRPAR